MILCVILVFIVPLKMNYARQDKIMDNVVSVEVTAFCDQVREMGYIREPMMRGFMTALDSTGLNYDIQIEHLSKNFAQDGDGDFKAYYEGFYEEEIFEILDSGFMYEMKMGDFFFIRVMSRSDTKSQSLNSMIGLPKGPGIFFKSGGIVRYGNG